MPGQRFDRWLCRRQSERDELPVAERGWKSNRRRVGRDGEDPCDGSRRQIGTGHGDSRHRFGAVGWSVDAAVRVLLWSPRLGWGLNRTGRGKRK